MRAVLFINALLFNYHFSGKKSVAITAESEHAHHDLGGGV
ncbi:hypothetical protein ALTERO38_60312 [Alteromonas sp. 38]|nr:hypothetical protein ALTER154_40481 [Alteromonas sp. 154]VXC17325.1 hypothetical protein ALTERO38_60312 [Alteromonas sp. 38]